MGTNAHDICKKNIQKTYNISITNVIEMGFFTTVSSFGGLLRSHGEPEEAAKVG